MCVLDRRIMSSFAKPFALNQQFSGQGRPTIFSSPDAQYHSQNQAFDQQYIDASTHGNKQDLAIDIGGDSYIYEMSPLSNNSITATTASTTRRSVNDDNDMICKLLKEQDDNNIDEIGMHEALHSLHNHLQKIEKRLQSRAKSFINNQNRLQAVKFARSTSSSTRCGSSSSRKCLQTLNEQNECELIQKELNTTANKWRRECSLSSEAILLLSSLLEEDTEIGNILEEELAGKETTMNNLLARVG